MPPLSVGTASAKPGKIVTGWFDAVALPTGEMDRFPVVIAQGTKPGPVLWITTGIHGPEHSGLIALHTLIAPELVKSLAGTIVAILTLNPAGLRTKLRIPYYVDTDPNRLFPKPDTANSAKSKGSDDDEARPADLELAYARLFDVIIASQPVALIDLHNASIGSLPFVFRDPVFYAEKGRKAMTRKQAEALQARTGEMIEAIGFTVINEFAVASYVKKNLHRSVSGSVLNKGGIPAITIELGSWMFIDPGIVAATVAGLRNALRWAGMLSGGYEAIEGIPVIKSGYAVRRTNAIYAPHAGIVHHLARPGEAVKKGQPLAQMRDIFGRPIGKDNGLIRSDYDGFVYGWTHGVVRYQGESIMSLAIRDDSELIVPYAE